MLSFLPSSSFRILRGEQKTATPHARAPPPFVRDNRVYARDVLHADAHLTRSEAKRARTRLFLLKGKAAARGPPPPTSPPLARLKKKKNFWEKRKQGARHFGRKNKNRHFLPSSLTMGVSLKDHDLKYEAPTASGQTLGQGNFGTAKLMRQKVGRGRGDGDASTRSHSPLLS